MVREEEIENEQETDDDVFSGSVSGSVTDKSSKTTAKSILSDVESEGAESVSTLNGPVIEKVSSLSIDSGKYSQSRCKGIYWILWNSNILKH